MMHRNKLLWWFRQGLTHTIDTLYSPKPGQPEDEGGGKEPILFDEWYMNSDHLSHLTLSSASPLGFSSAYLLTLDLPIYSFIHQAFGLIPYSFEFSTLSMSSLCSFFHPLLSLSFSSRSPSTPHHHPTLFRLICLTQWRGVWQACCGKIAQLNASGRRRRVKRVKWY